MSQSYASAGIPLDPDWQDWTPTLVNMTKGDGTITSRFVQTPSAGAELIVAHFDFTLGSTSTIGTGPTISVPVTASSTYLFPLNHVGGAVLENTGTETLIGKVRLDSATTFAIVAQRITVNFIRDDSLSATNPFTWASGDVIAFTAKYEAA